MKINLKTKTLRTICLISLLTLANICPDSVIAEASRRSREGFPGRRIGAGARSAEQCVQGNDKLVALVPENNLSLTKAAYPNLLFYVPVTPTSKDVLFVLLDKADHPIYQTTFKTLVADQKSNSGEIIDLSLVKHAKPLPGMNFNQDYHWKLTIVCDADDESNNISVNGWIKRITPQAVLAYRLEDKTILRYSRDGLWQDALSRLAELRYHQPQNSYFAKDWKHLLRLVNLDISVNKPLVKQQIIPDN